MFDLILVATTRSNGILPFLSPSRVEATRADPLRSSFAALLSIGESKVSTSSYID